MFISKMDSLCTSSYLNIYLVQEVYYANEMRGLLLLLNDCDNGACLHGRGFSCNRIAFDAVTPFVYTAPIEIQLKPDRFENALKSGAFSKRYGFIGRADGKTASI